VTRGDNILSTARSCAENIMTFKGDSRLSAIMYVSSHYLSAVHI